MTGSRRVVLFFLIFCLEGCTRPSLASTYTNTLLPSFTQHPLIPTISQTALQTQKSELATASATASQGTTAPTRRPTQTPWATITLFSTPTHPPVLPTRSPTITPTITKTPVFADPRELLSPGQYVVFWRANTWYIQGLDSAPPVRFMPVESPYSLASMSPDGKRVAFVDANEQIAIYELDTGILTTYPTPKLFFTTNLAWSPDSRMLLLTGTDDPSGFLAHFSIDILLLDTGEMRQLVSHENFTQEGKLTYGGYEASWSPDGRRIGFWGRLHGQTDYINEKYYIMDSGCIADPSTCVAKSKLIKDVSSLDVSMGTPTWALDGLLEFTCTIEGETGPCLENVDTSGSPYLLSNPPDLLSLKGKLAYLRWSPDGKYILFCVYNKTDTGYPLKDIYVVRADGSKPAIKLTNTPEDNAWLSGWSPDGQYAAFSIGLGLEAKQDQRGGYHPLSEIYIYSVTDGETIDLTNTPTDRDDFAFWMVIPNQFQPGSSYQITKDGNNLSLRDSPSLNGSVLRTLKTGDTVTILEGPVQADKYTWWKMRTADGVEGWAVDVAGWYAPLSAAVTPTLTPTP